MISFADITYEKFGFILAGKNGLHRTLNITLPEDLDYGSTFDDIFSAYTKRHALIKIMCTTRATATTRSTTARIITTILLEDRTVCNSERVSPRRTSRLSVGGTT